MMSYISPPSGYREYTYPVLADCRCVPLYSVCAWVVVDVAPKPFPDIPCTAHLWSLVPKAIPGKAFGTRALKSAAYGPFGLANLQTQVWPSQNRSGKYAC